MRGCLFGYWLTVDRHGLSALAMTRVRYGALCLSLRGGQNGRRGNPSCLEGHGRLVCSFTGSQWIATGLRPRDDKIDGFPFTLHPSNFTLLSLAFLETYTEAYVEVAAFGGVAVVALSRTQVCPVEVPGTTP